MEDRVIKIMALVLMGAITSAFATIVISGLFNLLWEGKKKMPTLYELLFWIGAIVAVATLWGVFSDENIDLYVSDYELDRLNGNKY